MSYWLTYLSIVSYRIVSYRIVSYRIVSYRIVSYRIVQYRNFYYIGYKCIWWYLGKLSNTHLKMCNCVWGDSLWEPLILRIVNSGSLSSKHATLSHWWFNIGPASLTVDQHWTNNGSMPRVCWELKLCLNDAIQNFKWVKITLKNKGLHDLYDLFFVVFKIIVGIIAALWAYVWGGGGGATA